MVEEKQEGAYFAPPRKMSWRYVLASVWFCQELAIGLEKTELKRIQNITPTLVHAFAWNDLR